MWSLFSLAFAGDLGQLSVTLIEDELELTIPNRTVTLSSDMSDASQERVSDADGEILFDELPPGLYRLVVPSSGDFGGVTIENIQVAADRQTQQIVRLRPVENDYVG